MITYLIAELGSNHCGKPALAHQLVDAAADAGASAVKFQKRTNKALYTKDFYDSPYISEASYGRTYGEHRERLELPLSALEELRSHAHERGIEFGCTAFDFQALTDLVDIEVDFVKIASGDLDNIPLIREACSTGLRVIVSTGGGTWADIDRVYQATGDIGLLLCTASYPSSYEDLGLSALKRFPERYPDADIGISLHVPSTAIAVAAVALGASIVEQHFTLDRSTRGGDHGFSLEPQDLATLVRDIGHLELAWGDGEKRRYPSEERPLLKMSKACYAARPMEAGHLVTSGDIEFRSPGGGLAPYLAPMLIGRRLRHDVKLHHAFVLQDVTSDTQIPATSWTGS